MNIHIDDTYVLTNDGMQFILERHATNQTEDSENFGERYAAQRTFHSSLELAFRKYLKLKLVESDATSFVELIAVVNKAHDSIDKAIKEIKQDMKVMVKI